MSGKLVFISLMLLEKRDQRKRVGTGERSREMALSCHANDCPGGDQGSIPPLTQQVPGDQETEE